MKKKLEYNMASEKTFCEELEGRRLWSAGLAVCAILPVDQTDTVVDVPVGDSGESSDAGSSDGSEGSGEVIDVPVDETPIDAGSEDTGTVDDGVITLDDPYLSDGNVDGPNVIFYCMGPGIGLAGGADEGADTSTDDSVPVDEATPTDPIDPAVCYFAVDSNETRGVDENGEIQPNFRGAIDDNAEPATDDSGSVADDVLIDPMPTDLPVDEVDPTLVYTCGVVDVPVDESAVIDAGSEATTQVDEPAQVTDEDFHVIYYNMIPEGAVAKGEVEVQATSVEPQQAAPVAGPAPTQAAPTKVDSIFSRLDIASKDDVLV